jgi:ATPase subunit of ABC transporter with duplicated ATPase domains
MRLVPAGCAVIISHDRWFLDRICSHTLAFEESGHVRMFGGNFSEYKAFMAKQGKRGADVDTSGPA